MAVVLGNRSGHLYHCGTWIVRPSSNIHTTVYTRGSNNKPNTSYNLCARTFSLRSRFAPLPLPSVRFNKSFVLYEMRSSKVSQLHRLGAMSTVLGASD
ncbi:predicted protein [Sclerotinia sclerotiorum 1980 UF-70]|uniref:Uncharacterized protein n=1 Tax=Sclerotinia sclerotiorum (strain ATCC 18683 / 1980 / Ss-1) TaxID=665079 RepID=A7EJU2_SCLS1|nr:predicted protein [Sclerotinia sclerotiorum 1980 UF-70]EDO03108.1 predicted protein [Sclerotinia sclerotiorum 1980 UF-70]